MAAMNLYHTKYDYWISNQRVKTGNLKFIGK